MSKSWMHKSSVRKCLCTICRPVWTEGAVQETYRLADDMRAKFVEPKMAPLDDAKSEPGNAE